MSSGMESRTDEGCTPSASKEVSLCQYGGLVTRRRIGELANCTSGKEMPEGMQVGGSDDRGSHGTD